MKLIFTLCVFFTLRGLAQAQAVAVAPIANVVANQPLSQAIQKKEQAFIDSQAGFSTGDYLTAENALISGNQAALNTPQWHFESGFMLIRMAFVFQSKGDAVHATAIAQRAIAHLTLADQSYSSTTSPEEIANEKEITGFLYEHLLGDRGSAKAFYQAAVNLSPNTGNAAASLAAIIASEATEAQKIALSGSN